MHVMVVLLLCWGGLVAGKGIGDGIVDALDVVEGDIVGEDVVEPVG